MSDSHRNGGVTWMVLAVVVLGIMSTCVCVPIGSINNDDEAIN